MLKPLYKSYSDHYVESSFTNKSPETTPETDTPQTTVYYETVAPDKPESAESGCLERYEIVRINEQQTSDEPVGQYSYITVRSPIDPQFLQVGAESLRKQQLK